MNANTRNANTRLTLLVNQKIEPKNMVNFPIKKPTVHHIKLLNKLLNCGILLLKKFGSFGKGMLMCNMNNFVWCKQPKSPEDPLIYFTNDILNPEEPEVLKIAYKSHQFSCPKINPSR